MSNRVWQRRRDPDWRKRRDGYWWWYIRLENGRTAWARAGYSSDRRTGRKRS